MSKKILFILEGESPERQITNSLHQYFATENTIIKALYGTTVYSLYQKIAADENLDTFNLVKEIDANSEILANYTRKDFAEIYLFFDYDGHASNAHDAKIKEMLQIFNEETDKGKLYISYPMTESLKHIEDYNTFPNSIAEIKTGRKYKRIANTKCLDHLKHLRFYTLETWKEITKLHLKKMNKIVNERFEMPTILIEQTIIFEHQLQKYIPNGYVSILSAFPVFLHDYYGNARLQERL